MDIQLIGIIVSVFVSIIGFICTYYNIKKEFKSELEKATNLERRAIYLEAYDALSRFLDKNDIIYTSSYIKELKKIQIKISLFGNKEVAEKFEYLVKTFSKIFNEYNDRITYYEYEDTFTDEDEKKYTCAPGIFENDSGTYWKVTDEYKKRHLPERVEMNMKISKLLELMKKNVGIYD